jgi:hypothetical protein
MTTIHSLRGGRAWHDSMALPVKVRNRLVPETIFVDLDGDGEQPALRMKIEVRQGVPVCTELRLTARPGGREIQRTDLRAVRIDSWIEQVVAVCSYEQDEPGGVITKSAPTPADRENARAARRNAPRSGRPKVPPERLHEVADLYRRHADGQPLLIVADVLGVSARTAARYVEKCRSDGLLPPRGKASAK